MLDRCLSLLEPRIQGVDQFDYEIIVSDDGLTQQAKQLVKANYPRVNWVQGPGNGPAANRNNGARFARGDWFLFIDDDCQPDGCWITAYRNAIREHTNCNAFEGAIFPDDWNLLKKDLAECPVNTEGGCFWSANIMLSKQLFTELGGFDERISIAAFEDQDLKRRIESHTAIIFVPTARVIHEVRFPSLKARFRQIPLRTSNFLYYAEKHAQALGFRNKLDVLLKGGLVAQGKAFFRYLSQGKLKSGILSLYCFTCVYLPRYLKQMTKPGIIE